MRYFCKSVLALGLVLGAAQPLYAHHSVGGVYDMSKSVKVTGTISKVEWINPHIFIHVDEKDSKGVVTSWSFESLPIAMMRRAGLSKESVMGQPGEVVTVTGIPARDGTRHLAIVSAITYADGHTYKLGLDGGNNAGAP